MKYLTSFLLLTFISLPTKASNLDDEIINNLEFFQNLELMKEDNPFFKVSSIKTNSKISETSDSLTTELAPSEEKSEIKR